MKKIIVLLYVFVALRSTPVSANELDTSLSLGTRIWPPVTNGLLFADGEFIPRPYTVSRVENEIYVNGHSFNAGVIWPPRVAIPPPPPPQHDPVMPASITEKTTPYDIEYNQYITDKFRYLSSKYGLEEGMKKLLEVHKKLPNTVNARLEPDSPGILCIKYKSGEDTGLNLIPPTRGPEKLTREEVISTVDKIGEGFVRLFSENGFYMTGTPHCGGLPIVGGTLFLLANGLHAAKDEAEFLALMKTNQPPGGMSERELRNVYKHRDGLSKWEPLAKRLYAEQREANLSHEDGLDALDPFIHAAPSADALIATLQAERPRLLRRIIGKTASGYPISDNGLFHEQELREFFKNRNNPEGWRPKPPPPYKPPSEIIETISAALAKAKTEAEFRAALAGKFNDTDWRDGFATWDKFLGSIWERRNNPGGWHPKPSSSSSSVSYTNAPPENPHYEW